ncbi:MAG TPA: biotin transporter BioY [Mogibacterium sp.]|nr:biotin transporter BioY [Mogibacterium sp.]
MKKNQKKLFETIDLIMIPMFAIVIAISGMLSIPSVVPFTMQTMGIFLTLLVLGGFQGTISILIYILLGSFGLPVFSGFSSGIGVLAGPTGGYIVGFLLIGFVYHIIESRTPDWQKNKQPFRQIAALLLGLFFCYTFGTLWFVKIYTGSITTEGIVSAISVCVLPFILPDLLKLWLAFVLSSRIKSLLNIAKKQ